MSIETFLSKLQKVRKRSQGQWTACCPAHDDRTPSLSIKDDNGTILIHCFGQHCGVDSIVSAVGMELHELFPPTDNYDHSQESYKRRAERGRYYYPSDQVLEALTFETLVIQMISKDMLTNGIDQETRERLILAVSRIHAASNYIRPK